MADLEQRDELIKSIQNRCRIYQLLKQVKDDDQELTDKVIEFILPTLLEDLYQDAQVLIDDYCVKEE